MDRSIDEVRAKQSKRTKDDLVEIKQAERKKAAAAAVLSRKEKKEKWSFKMHQPRSMSLTVKFLGWGARKCKRLYCDIS